MEKSCAGLLENLRNQHDIYRELLSLALAKQPVLVKGDVPNLERITKREELLLVQVGRLEEQRQSLHHALADHFALSVQELTFTELLKRLGENEKGVFGSLFNEITKILKKLAEVNDSNTELVKNSLDYINFSVNLLTNNSTSPNYKEEQEKNQSLAKIFDHTV